jgi:glycogen(starch) synthase
MRVLMLGWEFPPYISGGLGTACYGLTKAMSARGTDVLFVLPKSVDADYSSHVKLISPAAGRSATRHRPAGAGDPQFAVPPGAPQSPSPAQTTAFTYDVEEMPHVTFKAIPAWLGSPYQTPSWISARAEVTGKSVQQIIAELKAEAEAAAAGKAGAGEAMAGLMPATDRGSGDYAGDMLGEIQRYAAMAAQLTRGEQFDVIHAHDWMTYPAGLAIAAVSGKPLVVHVHSTEFDRSGESVDSRIYEIERRGMHGAMRVICVSHLTRRIVLHRYGVAPAKVDVVYNGIEQSDPEPASRIRKADRIVLFLGRITMQKGPEYFIAAARKVLQKFDKVKFVIAGSGDMERRIISLAAEMGIGHKVLFTGFLRGRDVDRIFQMADVYVMPSVSEPFGIAPLEAIRHDVPVIISKNSGVAEVLSHALKVDFWDVEEMANKIVAVLKHPPLSSTLREHADFEMRKLTWDTAAGECIATYQRAVRGLTEPAPVAAR